MPTPDFPPYRRRRNVGLRSLNSGFAYLAAEAMKRKRRKPGEEPEEGGVPVEPDRPLNLEGGAAAELDFDDE